MALPLIIRVVVDDVLLAEAGSAARGLLFGACAVFAGLVLVNYVANLIQESVVARVAEQVLFDLRRAMYAHLQRVALAFMDRTEVGRLMSRLQGDVNALQEFLESTVFAVGDLVLLVGIIVILLTLNVPLGLMTLAIIPALLIVRSVWLPFARRAFLGARQSSSTANGALAESINGVRLIQEMGRQRVNFDLYEEKVHDNMRSHVRASRFSMAMIPTVDTLSGLAIGLVVVIGGALTLGGSIELGVLVAFFFYVQRFFAPIRSVTMQYSIMQRAMASGQRIFEVLDVPGADRGSPRRARSGGHRRLGGVSQRHLRLRRGSADPARHLVPGGAGRDGGAGGADRLRQRPASPPSHTASTTCGRGRSWSAATTCAT